MFLDYSAQLRVQQINASHAEFLRQTVQPTDAPPLDWMKQQKAPREKRRRAMLGRLGMSIGLLRASQRGYRPAA